MRTQPAFCPCCGALLDAATSLSGRDERPGPQDFSICLYCATVLTFDEKGVPARASRREVRAASREDPVLGRRLEDAVALVRATRDAIKGPPPKSEAALRGRPT